MTQADYDKALRTITEALDHWVTHAVTRKSLTMLMEERDHAAKVLLELYEFYDEHEEARR